MSKEGLLVNCLTSERRTLLWVRSNPDRGCRILFMCKTMILLCQRLSLHAAKLEIPAGSNEPPGSPTHWIGTEFDHVHVKKAMQL